MKLGDAYPSLKEYDAPTLLSKVDPQTIFAVLPALEAYYVQHLPLWRVLQYYGEGRVSPSDQEANVGCFLLSHGGTDAHKSAKYYTVDRNTGAYSPKVFCFKCSVIKNSFYYTYAMEKDFRRLKFLDIFDFINRTFKVPFPTSIVLDFDPDVYYAIGNSSDVYKTQASFERAKQLRELKDVDLLEYLAVTVSLYLGRESNDKPI
jgi:hypothetical protein